MSSRDQYTSSSQGAYDRGVSRSGTNQHRSSSYSSSTSSYHGQGSSQRQMPVGGPQQPLTQEQMRKALFEGATETPPEQLSAEETLKRLQEGNHASLDNTVRMLSDAHAISTDTTTKLEAQSEQLKRLDRTVNSMNNTLSMTDRMLNGMKSLSGSISNWFSSSPKPENSTYDPSSTSSPASQRVSSTSSSQTHQFAGTGRSSGAGVYGGRRGNGNGNGNGDVPGDAAGVGGGSGSRRVKERRYRGGGGGSGEDVGADEPTLRFDESAFGDESTWSRGGGGREEDAATRQILEQVKQSRQEEDAKLEDISSMLDGLKQQAHGINKQLVHQSGHLKHISEQVSRADDRMTRQTKEIDRLGR